jgi:signal peptidase I
VTVIGVSRGQVHINGTAPRYKGRRRGRNGNGGWQHWLPPRASSRQLPGGREHPIFKMTAHGEFDDMPEVVVSPNHLFVMGDNRDNSADSRVPVRAGGVGLLPIEDLVGRVDAIVGSWDLAVKSKPIQDWPAGLRLSRFFTSVH